MADDAVLYEESQRWPFWVIAVTVGAGSIAAATIVAGMARGDAEPSWTVALALVCAVAAPAAVGTFASRLTVRVTRSAVRVAFGPVEIFGRTIPFERIRALEVVRYRPLVEFGGWGYRRGRGRKTAWTMKGSEAVVLHEADGRRTYLGSDDPGRLRTRIEAAAGGRFGPRGGAGVGSPAGRAGA